TPLQHPSFLPDERHFLFNTIPPASIYIGSLDGGTPSLLIPPRAKDATFVPPDLIVYASGDNDFLLAQRIDLGTLQLKGAPTSIVGPVRGSSGDHTYSVDREGNLVYLPGIPDSPPIEVNRSGVVTDTI